MRCILKCQSFFYVFLIFILLLQKLKHPKQVHSPFHFEFQHLQMNYSRIVANDILVYS